MNFSSFKKIYSASKEKIGSYHIRFTVDLWWRIIVVCFVLLNICSAVFGFFFFRSVNTEKALGELTAPRVESVFNRKDLAEMLKFYRSKESTLAKLQNSSTVRKDPSF